MSQSSVSWRQITRRKNWRGSHKMGEERADGVRTEGSPRAVLLDTVLDLPFGSPGRCCLSSEQVALRPAASGL